MASGRLFGNEGWNPTVILGRIGALQLVFYTSYYTALVILAMCLGTSLHPDYMLRGDSVTVLTSFGWAGVIAWFVADIVWCVPTAAMQAFERCTLRLSPFTAH